MKNEGHDIKNSSKMIYLLKHFLPSFHKIVMVDFKVNEVHKIETTNRMCGLSHLKNKKHRTVISDL